MLVMRATSAFNWLHVHPAGAADDHGAHSLGLNWLYVNQAGAFDAHDAHLFRLQLAVFSLMATFPPQGAADAHDAPILSTFNWLHDHSAKAVDAHDAHSLGFN